MLNINTMKKQKPSDEKQELRDRLLNYLDALGIKRLVVQYSGSGDSGQTDDINTEPAKRDLLLDELFEDTEKSLKEILDEFTWQAIEEHEGGFYNNEGGYGEVVFDTKNRTVTMEHNNYVQETVYSEYDL